MASAVDAASGGDARGRRDRTEIIVGVAPGATLDRAVELSRMEGAAPVERIDAIHSVVVRVPAHAMSRVVDALSRRHEIAFAEPNRRLQPVLAPNDPWYPGQWHLEKIATASAWDVTVGTDAVPIAILDTGIDSAHADLAAKLLPGWNFYDGNGVTTDVHGHGTKVAGAAAAITNNATGVAGVSWASPLFPLRVSDTSGYAYYSTIAQALTWAVDHGARVMNVSFEGVAGSSAIGSAASYVRARGGYVVAAAGNCSCSDSTPENPHILTVGATDSADALASFSTRGAFVDVSAPGVGIYTTIRGGGYGFGSGTSFASPITAGVVSLLLSAQPTLTPDEIDDLMMSTAIDLGPAGHDSSYGAGRIDAHAAVLAASGNEPAPADVTPPSVRIDSPSAGSVVSGTVSVTLTAFDDRAVSTVELYVDGVRVGSDTTAPFQFSWTTTTVADGPHTLSAVALDAAGNHGVASPVDVQVLNASTEPAPPKNRKGGGGRKR